MPKQDQGVEVSLKRNRYSVIPRTLVFITRGDKILLLHGSPAKKIWRNKYNGIGGHIERAEDVYSAARREVKEETGLDVDRLRLCGLINIDSDHESSGIMLFVFTAESQSGDPVSSDEGALEWIDRSQVTHLDLVEDLTTILPRALDLPISAPPFFAHYSYDEKDHLVIEFAASSSP
jgi:8-oxo-dGTP diphosphatase